MKSEIPESYYNTAEREVKRVRGNG